MMSAKLLTVVGLLGLVAMPELALADGAIAKSEDGATGMSYNYRGPRAADERALQEC